MKTLILAVFFLLTFHLYSQDVIIRKDGENIPCKIQRLNNDSILYKVTGDGMSRNIALRDVASYKINSEKVFDPTLVDNFSIGMGLGFDYGGFGSNVNFYPWKNVGFLASFGYAFAGWGVNLGCKIRYKSTSRFTPHALFMYGYNTAIIVLAAPQFNRIFYGPTVGFGFDFRHRRLKRNCWSFGLLIPFRGPDVYDYMDYLRITQGVVFSGGLAPTGISIGYRFIISHFKGTYVSKKAKL